MVRLKRRGTSAPPLDVLQIDLLMSPNGLRTLIVILEDTMSTKAYAALPMPVRIDIENLRNDAFARLQRIKS